MDIEKANLHNFRALMQALAYPGKLVKVESVMDSYLLGAASSLVSAHSFFYIEAEKCLKNNLKLLTGARESNLEDADYIIVKECKNIFLQKAKKGDFLNPENSATIFLEVAKNKKTQIFINGPGILKRKRIDVPLSIEFIEEIKMANKNLPLGIDLFLIDNIGNVLGFPRTLKIEVVR